MIDPHFVLDAVLAVTLAAVALRLLVVDDMFQAIVTFIAFGLLLAIAWCRLGAVDVALAEAAIGAGLTGALLMNTLAATQTGSHRAERRGTVAAWRLARRLALGLPAVGIAAVLGSVVGPLAWETVAPKIPVAEAMPQSGVANPVTAVLLNFRAFDTLLEVAVLLLAVLTIAPLKPAPPEAAAVRPVGQVLASFVRLVVPLVAVVAAYVLWIGTKAPGGAFQAAALLSASGVLLLVTGAVSPDWKRAKWRFLLVAGLALFLLVALGGAALRGHFLEYPRGWAGWLILLVETALTVSIAVILAELFSLGLPRSAAPSPEPLARGPAATGAQEPGP